MRCPSLRIYEPLLESNWRIQRSACRLDLGDCAPLVQFPAFQRLVSHRAPSLSRYEFGLLSGCQPLGSGTLRGSLPSCQHLPRMETPLAERSFCGARLSALNVSGDGRFDIKEDEANAIPRNAESTSQCFELRDGNLGAVWPRMCGTTANNRPIVRKRTFPPDASWGASCAHPHRARRHELL